MGGSGLDRTDDFQKFCGSGLDRIQFFSDQDWTRTEKFHSLLISGGNARGFEEGISKLVYRAGEGIFLLTVSIAFVWLYLQFPPCLCDLTISPVLCIFVTSVF